jgi:AcrR family transcriptional regulator
MVLSKPPSSVELSARRQPRQQRGVETVDAILEATAALLAERGFEGVNTNVVAERAGVRPPAVYRYFPNKFALYHALAAKLHDELDPLIDAALVDAEARPLDDLVGALLDVVDTFWQRRPAFGALWYGEWAIQGSPPPAIVFGERTVARLAAATTRFRHLGPLGERLALGAAMHIAMAVINLAGAAPAQARPLVIAEAKRAVLAYLSTRLAEQ